MKETLCPCKKEEETVLVRIYADYAPENQHFLKLSPKAKQLLQFLEDENILSFCVDWDFDLNSITKEF